MAEVTYEIKKHYGVISDHDKSWKKEVNLVSWCEGKPKIDIRSWNEDHTKMTRGITLTIDEARALIECLSDL